MASSSALSTTAKAASAAGSSTAADADAPALCEYYVCYCPLPKRTENCSNDVLREDGRKPTTCAIKNSRLKAKKTLEETREAIFDHLVRSPYHNLSHEEANEVANSQETEDGFIIRREYSSSTGDDGKEKVKVRTARSAPVDDKQDVKGELRELREELSRANALLQVATREGRQVQLRDSLRAEDILNFRVEDVWAMLAAMQTAERACRSAAAAAHSAGEQLSLQADNFVQGHDYILKTMDETAARMHSSAAASSSSSTSVAKRRILRSMGLC